MIRNEGSMIRCDILVCREVIVRYKSAAFTCNSPNYVSILLHVAVVR